MEIVLDFMFKVACIVGLLLVILAAIGACVPKKVTLIKVIKGWDTATDTFEFAVNENLRDGWRIQQMVVTPETDGHSCGLLAILER